jgi:hypothetical protein
VIKIRGKKIILYLIFLLLVTACSEGAKVNVESNNSSGDLSLINISLYRSDSHKVQPELIIAESDPLKLNSAEEWTKSGTPEDLPRIKNIEKIYLIQFQYSVNTTTMSVYYICVTDKNKNEYLKKIDEKQKTDLDVYDPTLNELILKKVGMNDWLKVTPSIFSLS